MFLFRRKRRGFGGNRVIFAMILFVLVMTFALRGLQPRSSTGYPAVVHYKNAAYRYEQTLRASPLGFVRKRELAEEGYIVLLLRKDNKAAVPEKVFVYQGFWYYRMYVLEK